MHIHHDEMKHRLHSIHDLCHEVWKEAKEEIEEALERNPTLSDFVEISEILKNLTAAKKHVMEKHKMLKEHHGA